MSGRRGNYPPPLEVEVTNLYIVLSFTPTDFCAGTLDFLSCSFVKIPDTDASVVWVFIGMRYGAFMFQQ